MYHKDRLTMWLDKIAGHLVADHKDRIPLVADKGINKIECFWWNIQVSTR